MAQDADEATNALIARMLAEDDAYDDPYGLGGFEDSDSDEWDNKRKKKNRKRKSGGGTRSIGRPKKASTSTGEADGPQEFTASGRRKRKDAGKKRATPTRAWTEEEERLFREALKLYGRDWKKCSEHVGTRDPRAFTSHCQKYFVKMCLQGKPLPRKVAESGEGYTLSGKPLDPNSAAAKAYGFKPDSLEKLRANGLASEVEGGLKSGQNLTEGEEGGDELPVPAPTIKENKENIKTPEHEEVKAAKLRRKKEREARERKRSATPEPVEPTEYAKNRPRRENAGRSAKSSYVSHMSGSLNLIPCKQFTGVAGAVSSQTQPYSVEISEEAMILMDFHAHLSCYEVIGYLGGEWNAEERKLTIRRAFPCKGLEGTQQTDSCEMDPAAEIEAKDKMDEWGLQAVGWYHSHPTFKPNPSEKDIENQENYQTLFHDEDSKSEPFVAMIYSPYDLRLPTKESRSEMFWVQKSKFGPTPMHMRHSRKKLEAVPTLDTKQSMIDLITSVDISGRIQLTELWRPFTRILDGKTPEGGPCTKLAKLRGALAAYLPESDESEDFFDELFTEIQSKWKVDLGY